MKIIDVTGNGLKRSTFKYSVWINSNTTYIDRIIWGVDELDMRLLLKLGAITSDVYIQTENVMVGGYAYLYQHDKLLKMLLDSKK